MYDYIGELVIKTSNVKKFLTDYHLCSTPRQEHLYDTPLDTIMAKSQMMFSLNIRYFVLGTKKFVCQDMEEMDSIMALKDHNEFKFI